ncbi:MAG TPA: hypothetical protein VK614_08215 [Allosphingosinicella sp.]|nr:hypothetical protein [Allosphingosinicella sp.]
MRRAFAILKLAVISLSVIGWIVFVPFASVVHGQKEQAAVALIVTGLLFGDVGAKAAIATLKTLALAVAWFWAITFLLFAFDLATLDMFLIPAYFYSTMIGVNWLIRRVDLRDFLRILAPGKTRTTLVVLRAFFDTGGTDVPRIAWYSRSLSLELRPAPWRAFIRTLGTVLATFIWLGQDVPVKMAIVENRQRHLGRQK